MNKPTISTKIDEIKALETQRATLQERLRELRRERQEILSKTEKAAQAVGEEAELERAVLHDQLAEVKKKIEATDSQADQAYDAIKEGKTELRRLREEYVLSLEASLLKNKSFLEVRSKLITIVAHWAALYDGMIDTDKHLVNLLDIDWDGKDPNLTQAKKDLLIG